MFTGEEVPHPVSSFHSWGSESSEILAWWYRAGDRFAQGCSSAKSARNIQGYCNFGLRFLTFYVWISETIDIQTLHGTFQHFKYHVYLYNLCLRIIVFHALTWTFGYRYFVKWVWIIIQCMPPYTISCLIYALWVCPNKFGLLCIACYHVCFLDSPGTVRNKIWWVAYALAGFGAYMPCTQVLCKGHSRTTVIGRAENM